MNIIHSVIPKSDFTLLVEFVDGVIGIFDVKPYLKYEAFEELNNIAEFNKIHNGQYFVEWDSGADLSADTLYVNLHKSSNAYINV